MSFDSFLVNSQLELDILIADLREWGYPYTGSTYARWQLLDNGNFLWDVPGEPEYGYIISSPEELYESVNAWRYDY